MENEIENEMMMDAVRDGDIETLELLLEQGSDPNFEDRWGTALGNASVKGRRDIYELLLYWGADPNLKNQYGETALSDAAQSGHTDIVRLLLDKGSDINYRINNGPTALMFASTWGYTDIVRLLLDNGANPNFVDSYGYTALTRATDNGHTAIVTLLMRYMTTIRMQSLQRGKMTRRKLRTSMARKRSSTSQLGYRYGLADDVARMVNSHMTRPNLTDMIDEIPRNMTGSIKRSKRKFAKRTKKRKPKRF